MDVDRVFRDCQNLPDIDYCNRSSICCSSDSILQASPTLLRIAEANIAGRYPINRVSLVAAIRVTRSSPTIIYHIIFFAMFFLRSNKEPIVFSRVTSVKREKKK